MKFEERVKAAELICLSGIHVLLTVLMTNEVIPWRRALLKTVCSRSAG